MTWTRPADWLALPTLAPTDQRFVGLFAVGDHDSNFCALTVTGTGSYIVDWGDGSAPETVASATTAYHKYAYADLVGTESSRGYRQAIVSVTMASGDFTGLNLNVKHEQAGLPTGYCVPWLEISHSTHNLTALAIGGTNVTIGLLERHIIGALGAITSLENTWRYCYSMASPPVFPAGSLTALTTMASAWQYCYSMASPPVFPAGSLTALTTMANAWYNCYSMASPPVFPAGSLTALITMASAWQYCYSMASPPVFPAGSLTALITMASAWQYCYSMASPPVFPAGSLTALTTIESTWRYCTAMASPPVFPAGSLTALTTMANAWYNCYSMASPPVFPAGSLTALTTMANAWQDCRAMLAAAVTCPVDAVTVTSTFSGATSIRTAPISIKNSFTIAACMSTAELAALIVALPDIGGSGYTMTISGNYGYAGLSVEQKAIGSTKGWNYA